MDKYCFIQYNIGIKDILKSILPIPYNNWWFITTYIIVYLLSNYINNKKVLLYIKLINKIEEEYNNKYRKVVDKYIN